MILSLSLSLAHVALLLVLIDATDLVFTDHQHLLEGDMEGLKYFLNRSDLLTQTEIPSDHH